MLSALNGKFGKIPSSAISERGVLGERDERGDGEEAGRRMGGYRGAQAATACSQAGKIAECTVVRLEHQLDCQDWLEILRSIYPNTA